MLDMVAPTTSPYLSAMMAAAVEPVKKGRGYDDDDDEYGQCFVCGSRTSARQAYCSDSCRAEDQAPSPAPAPTAVPALVQHRSDGSASSPPSSAEGVDAEDDIDPLTLPPAVAPFNKKANAFVYSHPSGTSHPFSSHVGNLAKSPVRSPIVRPVSNGAARLLSPVHGPSSSSRRPSTAPAAERDTTQMEVITFRRRYQPDSLNGNKQGNASSSPLLLASRRSSNILPSPLLLARNEAPRPHIPTSTAPRSVPLSTRSVSSGSPSPSTTSQSAVQAILAKLLHGTSISGTIPAAGKAVSPRLRAKTPSSATLRAPSTCHIFNRRVSEPLSPYQSPSMTGPEIPDPFEVAFAVQRGNSQKRLAPLELPASARRPALSATLTGPAGLPTPSSMTKAADYNEFAGYLYTRHHKASPVSAASKQEQEPTLAAVLPKATLGKDFLARKGDGTESGYDAQDEQVKRRKKPVSPTLTKRTPPPASNGQVPAQSQAPLPEAPIAGKVTRAAILREKLVNMLPGSSSSSSDSSVAAGPTKAIRHQYGRGNAFRSLLREDSTDADGVASSSSDDEARVIAGEVEEESRRGRRSRQSSAQTARTNQTQPTKVNEAAQRRSTVPTDQKKPLQLEAQQPSVQTKGPIDSALVTSSSSSSEEEERGRGRGRVASRKASSGDRSHVVSAFTALERVVSGTATRRQTDSHEEGARGRSAQRRGSAALQRSVSPARSTSRAGARNARRTG